MCECLSACVRAHVHVCVCVCVCVKVCEFLFLLLFLCLSVPLCVCVCAHVCVGEGWEVGGWVFGYNYDVSTVHISFFCMTNNTLSKA